MDLTNIKEAITTLSVSHIYDLVESMLPKSGMLIPDEDSLNEDFSHPNHMKRTLGRVAIVTRIRNGKVQLNKKVDIMGSGFKLTPSGIVVKMSPQEVMVRKQAAIRGARKRQVEMQSIIRKRMLSMRIRNSRIG